MARRSTHTSHTPPVGPLRGPLAAHSLPFASRLPGRTLTDCQARTCFTHVRPVQLVRTASTRRQLVGSRRQRARASTHRRHSRPGYPTVVSLLSFVSERTFSLHILNVGNYMHSLFATFPFFLRFIKLRAHAVIDISVVQTSSIRHRNPLRELNALVYNMLSCVLSFNTFLPNLISSATLGDRGSKMSDFRHLLRTNPCTHTIDVHGVRLVSSSSTTLPVHVYTYLQPFKSCCTMPKHRQLAG